MDKKNAFSLAEMMIVLLIVAIVMAASAPIMSKRMIRSAEGESPWLFTGNNGSITANPTAKDGQQVIIGAISAANGANGRLYVATKDDIPQLSFGYNSSNLMHLFTGKDRSITLSNIVNKNAGKNSIAIGVDTNKDQNAGESSIAIGQLATATAKNSIAIGQNVTASVNEGDINIGNAFKVEDGKIIIGDGAITIDKKDNKNRIFIGVPHAEWNAGVHIGAKDTLVDIGDDRIRLEATSNSTYGDVNIVHYGDNLLAPVYIGQKKSLVDIGASRIICNQNQSINIGTDGNSNSDLVTIGKDDVNLVLAGLSIKKNTKNHSIIEIGSESDIVQHFGSFVVNKDTILGLNNGYFFANARNISTDVSASDEGLTLFSDTDGVNWVTYSSSDNATTCYEASAFKDMITFPTGQHIHSDRRLKNVGEKFIGGLNELKKLELYHFTYKKDVAQTPRVGVMAQDLQKVFPDAVTKGDDGFLRIRLEDMFYAAINAIKELDQKMTALAVDVKNAIADITTLKTKQAEQEKTIAQLVEQNKQQQEQIDLLLKKVEKLEKKRN